MQKKMLYDPTTVAQRIKLMENIKGETDLADRFRGKESFSLTIARLESQTKGRRSAITQIKYNGIWPLKANGYSKG